MLNKLLNNISSLQGSKKQIGPFFNIEEAQITIDLDNMWGYSPQQMIDLLIKYDKYHQKVKQQLIEFNDEYQHLITKKDLLEKERKNQIEEFQQYKLNLQNIQQHLVELQTENQKLKQNQNTDFFQTVYQNIWLLKQPNDSLLKVLDVKKIQNMKSQLDQFEKNLEQNVVIIKKMDLLQLDLEQSQFNDDDNGEEIQTDRSYMDSNRSYQSNYNIPLSQQKIQQKVRELVNAYEDFMVNMTKSFVIFSEEFENLRDSVNQNKINFDQCINHDLHLVDSQLKSVQEKFENLQKQQQNEEQQSELELHIISMQETLDDLNDQNNKQKQIISEFKKNEIQNQNMQVENENLKNIISDLKNNLNQFQQDNIQLLQKLQINEKTIRNLQDMQNLNQKEQEEKSTIKNDLQNLSNKIQELENRKEQDRIKIEFLTKDQKKLKDQNTEYKTDIKQKSQFYTEINEQKQIMESQIADQKQVIKEMKKRINEIKQNTFIEQQNLMTQLDEKIHFINDLNQKIESLHKEHMHELSQYQGIILVQQNKEQMNVQNQIQMQDSKNKTEELEEQIKQLKIINQEQINKIAIFEQEQNDLKQLIESLQGKREFALKEIKQLLQQNDNLKQMYAKKEKESIQKELYLNSSVIIQSNQPFSLNDSVIFEKPLVGEQQNQFDFLKNEMIRSIEDLQSDFRNLHKKFFNFMPELPLKDNNNQDYIAYEKLLTDCISKLQDTYDNLEDLQI